MIKTIFKAIGFMLLGAVILAVTLYGYSNMRRLTQVEQAIGKITQVLNQHNAQIQALTPETKNARRRKR